MRADRLILSCEHAGAGVPPEVASCFEGADAARALASHRGWDPGALAVARILARELDAPLRSTPVSRLVVDANRSESNPEVFSEWTAPLGAARREELLARHHRPHRAEVERVLRRAVDDGARAIHLGVHSFTPELAGSRRDFDLGLLYDPDRPAERALAEAWDRALAATGAGLSVRHNQPYLGTDDGLTTTLRGLLPPDRYLGLELEINQRLLECGAGVDGVRPGAAWVRAIVESLAATLAGRTHPAERGVARRASVSHRLDLDVEPQPDDSTCGPTSLSAVYAFHGDRIPLERVIAEVQPLETGGTLAVHLACHALGRGYGATIYTYNLQLFDPTWFEDGRAEPTALARRLRLQAEAKHDPKLRAATEAYLEFLELGGRVRTAELDGALLRRHLKRGRPILAGLNATYLYGCAREVGEHELHDDDVRGVAQGHFVVLIGYDRDRREVLVADPLHDNPFSSTSRYPVGVSRLVSSILLGVLTYDANLLVLEPPDLSEPPE